jgi:outer membrane immunogenic protein
MHNLLRVLGVSSLLLAAPLSAASAADMPLKAPPPAPWYDWTGFYAGLNLGYSWGRSWTSYTGTSLIPGGAIAPFSTSQNMDGILGGGQIGYNWQFNRNWLFGLEADIQGTGQRGTATLPTVSGTFGVVALFPYTTTATLSQKLPWFGTVRARLGFEPSDHWLLYATGGLAYGEVDSTYTVSTTTVGGGGPATTTAAASSNSTRAGWTIGAGSEWALSGQWTAKVEYLYIDLGHDSTSFTGGSGAYSSLAGSSHVTDNILRVGLNYRFPK